MFGLGYISILLLLLFILYCFAKGRCTKSQNYRSVQGPLGLPVVGHLPFLFKDPLSTLTKWQKRYGDIFRIKLGSWETVVVNGFQAISDAAGKNDDVLSSRPPFLTQRVLRYLNYGEESLIFSPFNDAFVRHKNLSSSALRMLVRGGFDSTQYMVIEEAIRLADRIIDKCSPNEFPVCITDEIQLTVGTISYYLFLGGGDIQQVDEHVKEIIQASKDVLLTIGNGNAVEIMPWLEYVLPWKRLQYTQLLKRFVNIRDQQIADHVGTFEACHIRDVIDAMLKLWGDDVPGKSKGVCSQDRLLFTTQEFIGGGFNTSAALLCWFVKYMATYPDVQRKVQEEIGLVRRIEYKDRQNLLYTDAVFHEVLRMSCVLPLAFPHYTSKDATISGCDIKKDSVVIFNFHSVAYEESFWGDPDCFRPERFLTTDGLDRSKCNRVVAFGIGRRKCVGEEIVRMSMFLLFTTLLQKCSFIHEDGDIDIQPVQGLLYMPKPFCVIVKKRIE